MKINSTGTASWEIIYSPFSFLTQDYLTPLLKLCVDVNN